MESDFFPLDIAKKYDAVAESVIKTGQPVINHEEVMWIETEKSPGFQ